MLLTWKGGKGCLVNYTRCSSLGRLLHLRESLLSRLACTVSFGATQNHSARPTVSRYGLVRLDQEIPNLEQTDYSPGFRIQIDVVEHGTSRQPGHGAHLSQERVKEPGTHRGANVSDGNNIALWYAF